MSVTFSCADPALQRLWDEAERGCAGNLRDFGGETVLVEGGGYEKIWLETQPMGGEMYAAHSLEAAINNSLLFMRHQRADGRLPGSIQCAGGRVEPQFNKLQGFCFARPALNLYYLMGRDRLWLERLESCLRRFDEYLWRTREKNGVLRSYCAYDTGEDNALRYGDAPGWWEAETPPEGYAVVPMESMDVTSYSYACRDALARISRIRGDGREAHWRERAEDVRRTLRARLWDEARGALFDRDRQGKTVDVLCHNTLRCMHWGSIDDDMAERFLREHLMNPAEFFTPMPLPSAAVSDPAFRNNPGNDWSGQPEGLTFQRAIAALENYGHASLLPAFGQRLFRAIIGGGYRFTQQYDPFTGAPSPGPDRYGPTMLAAMAYIEHIWGVHLHMGEVWFTLGGGMAYQFERRWGGHVYRIESDGVNARACADGRELCAGPCGARVVADEDGRLLRGAAGN